jgi:hypothetical protein
MDYPLFNKRGWTTEKIQWQQAKNARRANSQRKFEKRQSNSGGSEPVIPVNQNSQRNLRPL